MTEGQDVLGGVNGNGLKAKLVAHAEKGQNQVLQVWIGQQIIKYGIPVLIALAGAGFTYIGHAVSEFKTEQDNSATEIIHLTDNLTAQTQVLLQQTGEINDLTQKGETRYNSQNDHISALETDTAVLKVQLDNVKVWLGALSDMFRAKRSEAPPGP